MLRGEATCSAASRPSFHYLTAPLYLLTAVVAALLIADWVVTVGHPVAAVAPSAGPTLWGYRLALLAAVLGGARILYQTLDGLLSGRVGADLALTIACLAAIALGEHQTAALVVLIALVGECIEGYTIDRARSALRDTFALWPLMAHRIENGNESDVAVEQLSVGDVVIVRPGERVPVDGHVVSGNSTVDQSSFTGESVPVDKAVGSAVFAGTLNQFGALTVAADSIGDQTALARMASVVGTAMSRKAHLERTADRLAKWFLPTVLVAALATLLGWRISMGSWRAGCLPALAVLVVACPCPLVLATPCAVMASLAWLARRGVVIKGSSVLERLAIVDTFAFDKTGTLTQGALAIGEIIPLTGLSSTAVLRTAAIAERTSEHLVGRLILKAAQDRGLTIPFPVGFNAVAGAGVTAKISQDDLYLGTDPIAAATAALDQQASGNTQPSATVVVGNRRALDQSQIPFSQDVALVMKEREALGESPLVVAVDNTVIGIIGVRETVRAESRHVLDELRTIGMTRFALLTGDRQQPTDSVVKSLDLFDTVASEQRPEDKAAWIEEAQKSGRKVAMVGDGVNDAPALAMADVGIALGRAGGDLVGAAGEVVLLGDPLRPLPGLVRLSRALVQNIWQSIVLFAIGLNGLGVLACSFGWLDPIGGAIFHEIASLAVMGNAMRLLWFEGWTSPATNRWIENGLSLADWLALNASPTKWVYWCLERWQLGLKLCCAACVAAWFLSGIVLLSADEQAVVTRFGRYQTTLSAGVYWCWPYPLDRIIRSQVGRVRSVAIGFRDREQEPTTPAAVSALLWNANRSERRSSLDGPRSAASPSGSAVAMSPIEWTSSHDERDRSSIGNDGMLLSADEVPVELMAEVQYRIKDLREFVFAGPKQPAEVLRATSDGVLREVAASVSLDNLLTDRRAALERRSLAMLRDRIAAYAIGVEIIDLQWLDVHPPQAVVPAYRQAADALEERELMINEAESYASRTILAAIGADALARLQQAARQQKPDATNSPVRIDWTMTDELWRELTKRDGDGKPVLSGSAAAAILEGELSKTQRELSSRGIAQRFEKLFTESKNQPKLTRDYLYWKAMVEVLPSRSITIIDPKAVGRRQLWLTEPVQGGFLPMPAPKEVREP